MTAYVLVQSREDLRVEMTRIRNRIGNLLQRREMYPPLLTERMRVVEGPGALTLLAAGAAVGWFGIG